MKRTVMATLLVALLAGVALLFTCAGEEAGAASPAPAGYGVDPEASWVVAVTEKGGIAGFLGHRHAVLVTDWTAEVDWRPGEPSASGATVTVPAASLRIDTARGRELAGLGAGPDEDDVAELQEKVLGAENLAADEHPELRLEIDEVEPRREGFQVAGRLTVRGRTVPVSFPVEMEETGGGAVRLSGSFTVKQTAFGIEPESVAGVVKVADPVEIRFLVTLRPGT